MVTSNCVTGHGPGHLAHCASMSASSTICIVCTSVVLPFYYMKVINLRGAWPKDYFYS
jgi:hypothetical protein